MRALDILTALIERAGELVTKEELIASAWPDTVVHEGNLKVHIAAIRRVLGEGRNDQRYGRDRRRALVELNDRRIAPPPRRCRCRASRGPAKSSALGAIRRCAERSRS